MTKTIAENYTPFPNRLLLDTHVLIWLANGENLGKNTLSAIKSAESVYASSISFWEISIKTLTGRIIIDEDFENNVLTTGISELYLTKRHTKELRRNTLKNIKTKDPFDHMLIIQAISDNLTLVTADKKLLGFNKLFVDALK